MIEERRLLFPYEFESREALLASRGLTVPGNEDVVLGLFDDEHLLATGSLVGDIIQGVAVDARHENEGLSARLVSSLIRRAAEKRVWHLFLFTKPQEARLFADMGFSPVASAGEAALLEWGRPDVESFKRALAEHRVNPAPDTACVVVNCNPFTRGHRRLIETASKQSAWVFVMVVEEDLSIFPFDVRFRLVRAGTSDMDNVTVLAGGRYIVSSATFPSYFTQEERHAETHAALDAELFVRHIAPSLGVSRRFVGQEPFSAVTGVYNQVMRKVFSGRGVDLIEIPRFEVGCEPVSASRVRALIAEGRLIDVEPMVPGVTWQYLLSEEAAPVLKRIRG